MNKEIKRKIFYGNVPIPQKILKKIDVEIIEKHSEWGFRSRTEYILYLVRKDFESRKIPMEEN